MKNCFGNTPTTIYGDGAGLDEPSKVPQGARGMLHAGDRQPPKSSLAEIDPHSSRDPGYRVPRVTADLVAARPIHLAIIDGIESVAGGEGSNKALFMLIYWLQSRIATYNIEIREFRSDEVHPTGLCRPRQNAAPAPDAIVTSAPLRKTPAHAGRSIGPARKWPACARRDSGCPAPPESA